VREDARDAVSEVECVPAKEVEQVRALDREAVARVLDEDGVQMPRCRLPLSIDARAAVTRPRSRDVDRSKSDSAAVTLGRARSTNRRSPVVARTKARST
jgi:hypothetical protein